MPWEIKVKPHKSSTFALEIPRPCLLDLSSSNYLKDMFKKFRQYKYIGEFTGFQFLKLEYLGIPCYDNI